MERAAREVVWGGGRPAFGDRTAIAVRPTAENRRVVLASGTLAPGCASVTINWGDGAKETLEGSFLNLAHDYEGTRERYIRIENDLSSLALSSLTMPISVRDLYVELLSVGSKVATIPNYAFNNLHNMRGRVVLPGVTSVGSYAFGSLLGVTDIVLPSVKRLSQTTFYTGPSARRLWADAAESVDADFGEYYGTPLDDLYIRGLTRAQIAAMPGFPFSLTNTRFHGSDGVVLSDGGIL